MLIVNEQHKQIVEEAGAMYEPGMFGCLVLFTSRQTGSTLALAESALTVEAVREHVRQSNLKFGIKEAALCSLVALLRRSSANKSKLWVEQPKPNRHFVLAARRPQHTRGEHYV